MSRFGWTAACALAGVVLSSSCELRPTGPDRQQLAELRVSALVVGTPIDLLVVRVTATPLVFNLAVQNGVAQGTIRLPPGTKRMITVDAYDTDGDITAEGIKTIDVKPGQNPPVSIPLVSKAGQVTITVTIGPVSVVVQPTAPTVQVGATLQLSVTITAANGDVLADPADWATTNPAVATVDGNGNVMGVMPGTVDIVASFAGVAGVSHVTVASQAQLYVLSMNSTVTVYAAGASGDAMPTATILGGNTLDAPSGIALDGAGNIYVTNEGNNSITVYAAGASGNAMPMATIAGGNTGLNFPFGVALDGAGNIYVTNPGNNSITIYAAGASGNAMPTATITGGNTGLSVPFDVALDGAGNIYVINEGNNSITVYAAGASGNAIPTATIMGGNTLQSPNGMALDGAGNIYVTSLGNNSITVYAAGASGNAMPTATIAGGNTGLRNPAGIALDGAGNIYVTNEVNNSITVYAAGASGNAMPTATIAGGNTGLSDPLGITLRR